MKRVMYSLFAAALVVLGGCQDETTENLVVPAQTGDEITFGSSLTNVETRTIYGDEPINGEYPVRWEKGDQISIYCPEAAQGKIVKYTITPDSQDPSKSSAVTKINADEAGLQWGQAEVHHFSAFHLPQHKEAVQIKSIASVHDRLSDSCPRAGFVEPFFPAVLGVFIFLPIPAVLAAAAAAAGDPLSASGAALVDRQCSALLSENCKQKSSGFPKLPNFFSLSISQIPYNIL